MRKEAAASKQRGRVFSLFYFLLGLFFLICGLLPLVVTKTFHYGALPLWGLTVLFWGNLFVFRWLHKNKKKKLAALLHSALWFVIAVIVFFCGTISYFASYEGAPFEPDTVVVLGHRVAGGHPSTMLKGRLDEAFGYLTEHPDAVCVVTGGVESGYDYTQAQIMKAYLVDRGLASERIYLEDRSINTQENLQFAAQIINANGLSYSIAVATDGFHQWRAYLYANESGLNDCLALSSQTPWALIPCYMAREFFAILKAALI